MLCFQNFTICTSHYHYYCATKRCTFQIFAIGIGNANEVELRGIASSNPEADHVQMVPTYAALEGIVETIINVTCASCKCLQWEF